MPQFSPLASAKATIAVLQQYGLYTKKSLGQHFLVADGVVGKILRLADTPPSMPILEVGPGIGTLTMALLAAGNRVIAVEKDERLRSVLDDIAVDYPDRFSYLVRDALTLEPADLPSEFVLVANLPYSVAATIVMDAFERFEAMQSATVMLQREVAARIMAQPASKTYGAYTVKLALMAQVVGSFAVSRSSFLPPPNVDSTVVRLDRVADSERLSAEQFNQARQVIDAAFAERRKKLRNSLLSNLDADAWVGEIPMVDLVDRALQVADIDGNRRAEDLSVAEFKALTVAMIGVAFV